MTQIKLLKWKADDKTKEMESDDIIVKMRRLTINGKRNYIFGLFMVCVIVILAWYISGNYYQLLLISGIQCFPHFMIYRL